MQALWSKVGQVHRCRCKACVDATNILTRRSTSATSAGRWKPTVGDLFTACYTTLVGAAVFVDVGRKDARRRELDRQIEQAKTALAKLQAKGPGEELRQPALPQIENTTVLRQSSSINEILEGQVRSRQSLRIKSKLMATYRDEVDGFWAAVGQSGESNTALTPADYDRIEQAILKEESDMRIRMREPMTSNQLKCTEHELVWLVEDLLAQVGYNSTDFQNANFYHRLQRLGDRSFVTLERPIANPNDSRGTRKRLRAALRSTFSTASINGLRETITQLCRTLAESRYPLDIHTYNTLITGFDRLGCHDLSRTVVKSFYTRSKVRPTKQTAICLLNHHTARNNIAGFDRTIWRMLGMSIYGLKIRSEPKSRLRSAALRRWAKSAQVTEHNGYLVERAPIDLEVLEAIMKGFMHFELVHQAAEILSACLARGWYVSADLLSRLLDQCVARMNRRAALVIIKAFVDNMKKAAKLFKSCDGPRLAEQLYSLLGVGGVPRPFDADAASVMAEKSRKDSSKRMFGKKNLYHHELEPEKFREFHALVWTMAARTPNRLEDATSPSWDMSVPEDSWRLRALQVRLHSLAYLSHTRGWWWSQMLMLEEGCTLLSKEDRLLLKQSPFELRLKRFAEMKKASRADPGAESRDFNYTTRYLKWLNDHPPWYKVRHLRPNRNNCGKGPKEEVESLGVGIREQSTGQELVIGDSKSQETVSVDFFPDPSRGRRRGKKDALQKWEPRIPKMPQCPVGSLWLTPEEAPRVFMLQHAV
jgi:hypothetical protein